MNDKSIEFTEPHLLSGLPKDSPILVALSGGADSSALLSLLTHYSAKTGCRIVVAHVNHGIRGEEYGFEADRDEEFCRTLCNSLSVPLFVKKLDVPALAKKSGRSLETEAREARYGFFAEIMRENNVRILATAHNADDNVETQLFNLCRGCGIDGMVGIPKTRKLEEIDGGIVIRPILKAQKRDIIAYCEQNGIGYVTDRTNLETDCTRNAIRHKVIPELENIFHSAKSSAQKLAESAAEDSDFIIREAKRFLDNNPRLEVKKLRELHPSPLKRVLMLAFAAISDTTLETVHLDALISLLSNPKNGAAASLPGRQQATVLDGMLVFGEEQKIGKKEPYSYSQKLTFGLNIIENTFFAVLISDCDGISLQIPEKYMLYTSAVIKADLKNSLYAKSRTPSACVKDGGINKKVKKLMCDKKVPLHDRNTLPVIYSGEKIIYVPLCAVSDSVRVKKDEKNISIHILKKTSEE